MIGRNIGIKDAEYTKTIYLMIKEVDYTGVINILNSIHEASTTRSGLSLLGHCYYQSQDFIEASNCYEMLCDLCPDVAEYKLYYAQSLYQSGLFDEALKVSNIIDAEQLKEKVMQLQSAIYYSNEDYSASQSILLQRQTGSAPTLNDEGCLLYQANLYDDALQRYFTSLQTGFNPLTAYNAALCHYRKKEHSLALNMIGEIIERGIRNYPELGIGAQAETEGGARSVGNPSALSMSGLVQALNLKAAIEYQEGNVDAAREALMDLPPRTEPELDPVTLHNMALTGDQNGGSVKLRRLAFLLELGPICPMETFSNLLLLCCKHEMFDTAADILAEHAQLTYKYLSPYLYDLLDALITSQTSQEEAERKLGVLSSNLASRLRTLSAKVQECRMASDQNALRNALREYESVLENYLPVAMSRAWIYWRENDFTSAEREFRASAEFCSETIVWRLHAAHVLFMRGDKYKESAAFYEAIVRQSYEDILSVSAIVLANLCVGYIMTSQNEQAEELMRRVERAEERKGNADGQCLHLCIINLVIGTLYCAKGNYEFGLSRIAHALMVEGESNTRLCADTWLHVKRCILGLLGCLAKQTIVIPSLAIQDTQNFLHACEVFGLTTPSVLSVINDDSEDQSPTIGIEARKLRYLLMKIMEYE
ncbi:unnamed protein product [Diamesa serratosioi]